MKYIRNRRVHELENLAVGLENQFVRSIPRDLVQIQGRFAALSELPLPRNL
jgi:hypothetical protein